MGQRAWKLMVGENMSQQLEFPASKAGSIQLISEGKLAWVVQLKEDDVFLVCLLIAANIDTFYVSCVGFEGGDLPDYVKPMKRGE